MENPLTLCSSCGEISLAALIKAIPIPSSSQGGSCGVPNSFHVSMPRPLLFPDVEASSRLCALCSLVSSQSKLARESSIFLTSGHLELAPLCPPSWVSHDGLTDSLNRKPFAQFGEPQPQWYAFLEGEKRVNTLEPITQRFGTRMKTKGYKIGSPWQINVAADEGA